MPYKHQSSVNDEGDLNEGHRICVSCDLRKHITEFYWTGKKTGRRRTCKECCLRRAQELRNQDRVNYRRRRNGWRLKIQYGLTLEDYDRLLTEQDQSCKICSRRFDLSDQSRRPHVDHCHKTGKVRGILCFKCNTAIGKLNDDPRLLRAAAAYLEDECLPLLS